jgi:hypothetical protein
MLEALLTKKKPKFGDATGIAIDGFTGTPTQSSGVTKDGDSYSFSAAQTNWLRIPYAGTPNLVGEDTEIICRFVVETIPSTRLNLFSRYRQGNDPPSWMIAIEADGSVNYVYNNRWATMTGPYKIQFGVEQKIVIRRQGALYQVYLNDNLILSLNYPGTYANTWDWVFGSYLNGSNGVILNTYSFPAKWTLLGFSAKRI